MGATQTKEMPPTLSATVEAVSHCWVIRHGERIDETPEVRIKLVFFEHVKQVAGCRAGRRVACRNEPDSFL